MATLNEELTTAIQRYYFESKTDPDPAQYQSKFAGGGADKAKTVLEFATEQNVELSRFVYVSVGGADGSEIVSALENSEINFGILIEKDPSAAAIAEATVQHLRQSRKALIVLCGDVMERLDDCRTYLRQWKALGIDGIICSAQAVLHELPRRSPRYVAQTFFGALFGIQDLRIFHSREPVELGDDEWPDPLWLRVGDSDNLLISQETLKGLGLFLADKFHLDASSVQEMRDGFVQLPRNLAREAARFVVYFSNEQHFRYETFEQHNEIAPREFAVKLSGALGAQVTVERTSSKTFNQQYAAFKITAQSPNGERLPAPKAFAIFKGAHIPAGKEKAYPRRIYANTFKGELSVSTGSSPDCMVLLAKLNASEVCPPERSFPLRLRFSASYEDLVADKFTSQPLTPSLIASQLPKRILIHGAGGAGKSSVLYEIAKAALSKKIVVQYVITSKGRIGGETLPPMYSLAEFIDTLSVTASLAEFLQALQSGGDVLLIIDGLNEVYREASEQLLLWLEAELQTWPNLSVVVADRMTPQRSAPAFERATVPPLTDEDVASFLHPPEDAATLALLRMPFFLDLQLVAQTDNYLPRKGMIERYLEERGKVANADWQMLSRCAFESYGVFRSRSFERSFWVQKIGESSLSKLEMSGVITPAGEHRMFRHQLLHDYLVGRHLSNLPPEAWTSDVFDAATFKANSNEALALATELLPIARADALVRQVYDWNYHASFQCIADVRAYVSTACVSPDLETALTALVAEKRFDVFEETVLSAEKTLGRLNTPVATAFRTAQSLRDLIESIPPMEGSYARWRQIFTRDESPVVEGDIADLDGDPLIGWTTANVLRRHAIASELHGIVRHVYRSNQQRPTHRWRAVHLLGRLCNDDNINLLWSAALHDEDSWVRYGSVRSLMEIAFYNGHKRSEIIQRFMDQLSSFDSGVGEAPILLREIGKCCVIAPGQKVPRGWYTSVSPLAHRAAQLPGATQERIIWDTRLQKLVALADKERL